MIIRLTKEQVEGTKLKEGTEIHLTELASSVDFEDSFKNIYGEELMVNWLNSILKMRTSQEVVDELDKMYKKLDSLAVRAWDFDTDEDADVLSSFMIYIGQLKNHVEAHIKSDEKPLFMSVFKNLVDLSGDIHDTVFRTM